MLIGDTYTFYANSHTPATGGVVVADAPPTYRVYEDETTTPILTGNMAALDAANATGFYSEQITLSAANGFEAGKSYCIRIAIVVGGVTGTQLDRFQIESPSSALVDAIWAGAPTNVVTYFQTARAGNGATLMIGNDQTLEVSGVRDEITGDYINNATVTAVLKKKSGTQVSGETWPITLTYVTGSSGDYRGNIDDAVVLENGKFYIAEITVNAGGGSIAFWRKELLARYREFGE